MKPILRFVITGNLLVILLVGTSCTHQKHEVKFTYEDESAKTVHLVGTMNHWDKFATPMTKKDGYFEVTIELFPGEYEYKFLIDGKEWILDPNNELTSEGWYTNSLLVVGTEQEREEIMGELRENAELVTKFQMLEQDTIPFRFAVLGDNRGNEEIYTSLLDKIADLDPDFAINTGDLITNPGDLSQWDEFIYWSSGYDFPILPVVGNHDVEHARSERMYIDIFTLPGEEIYYSFPYGNSQFIVLDSEVPEEVSKITGTQLEWLIETLQSSTSQYRFVFLHRPLYPDSNIGRHYDDCLNIYPEERDSLMSIFKNHGVNAIFVGHDHLYRMTTHGGIIHIITGGGGAPLYADEENGGFYHFVLVDVYEDKIEGNLYRLKDGDFVVTPIFSLPAGN